MRNIVVFASGAGSNAGSLFRQAKDGRFGEVRFFLISDNPNSGALKLARDAEIWNMCVNPGEKAARISSAAEHFLLEELKRINPSLIVLAGFMRIMPASLVGEFEGRMINLHPSLLPLYKGKDAIRRAFEAGEHSVGCTVHYVSNELDGGCIIAQSKVDVLNGDTLDTLTQRVHEAEHKLLGSVVAELLRKEDA